MIHRSSVIAIAASVALVSAGVLVSTPPASAGDDPINVSSNVTFKPQQFGGRDTGYYPTGYVRSALPCRERRAVTLFRKVAGPDQEVLQTTTKQDDGYWESRTPPPLEPGTYYARIERRKIAGTSRSFCTGDRSPDVKVEASTRS